jgi:AcrR family transcriptional regulator
MVTRLSADERGRQLLIVARQIVDQEGPASLTMERIAERCGVTKPMVYRHFANRSAVVKALLEDSWRQVDRTIAERVAAATGPAERIRASFSGFLDHTARQGPSFDALVSSVSSDPEIEALRRSRWAAQEARWAAGFRENFALSEATADAAAAVLHGALAGAVAHAGHSAEARREAETVVVTAIFATLRALAAPAGGGQT